MRSLVLAACASCLLVCSTGCDELICNPPSDPEYSCSPVPIGTPGTCGELKVQFKTYNTDKGFPEGCSVRLPECTAHSSVLTCDCQMEGTELRWVCPI
jgi:hypothetical protein